MPLAGDRKHGEDEAIVGGFGRFRGDSVCVIGHEKGSDTDSRLKHNFGMARPEGYRKAARLMGMADHFDVPVIALIDTAGAYPGIGAEERGQAEAIARSTEACLDIGVPNVAAIIGEGGSGGAIAIATANRVIMLEHAIYSVISPEGAASILWRDTAKAQDAASSMKITAQDLVRFGIVDTVVPEPTGGAHRDPAATIAATGDAIAKALGELRGLDRPTITRLRREKFIAIGRDPRLTRRRCPQPRVLPQSCRDSAGHSPFSAPCSGLEAAKSLGLPGKFDANLPFVITTAWSMLRAGLGLPCESHLLRITIMPVMARGWSIGRGVSH